MSKRFADVLNRERGKTMTTDRITEHLNSLTPWALACMAECFGPDTEYSLGARFLCRVRDYVVDDWDRLTDRFDDPDYDGAVSEIADVCVLGGTHELWTTFVDLGAYREDVSDYGPVNGSDLATTALYMIAERLVYALVDEGKELDDEEGED